MNIDLCALHMQTELVVEAHKYVIMNIWFTAPLCPHVNHQACHVLLDWASVGPSALCW